MSAAANGRILPDLTRGDKSRNAGAVSGVRAGAGLLSD